MSKRCGFGAPSATDEPSRNLQVCFITHAVNGGRKTWIYYMGDEEEHSHTPTHMCNLPFRVCVCVSVIMLCSCTNDPIRSGEPADTFYLILVKQALFIFMCV